MTPNCWIVGPMVYSKGATVCATCMSRDELSSRQANLSDEAPFWSVQSMKECDDGFNKSGHTSAQLATIARLQLLTLSLSTPPPLSPPLPPRPALQSCSTPAPIAPLPLEPRRRGHPSAWPSARHLAQATKGATQAAAQRHHWGGLTSTPTHKAKRYCRQSAVSQRARATRHCIPSTPMSHLPPLRFASSPSAWT